MNMGTPPTTTMTSNGVLRTAASLNPNLNLNPLRLGARAGGLRLRLRLRLGVGVGGTARSLLTGVTLLALAAGAFAQTPPAKHQLVFRNGDRLYGALQSFTPAGGIAWRHADASELIQFSPTNVTEVQFGERRLPAAPAPALNLCHVRLANSDELSGNLLLLDGEKLLLDTWFAGTLTIPRARVRSITPASPAASVIYEGPAGLEGWTMGRGVAFVGEGGEWKFANGAFYATQSASIARDLKLPDRASLEFEMAWRGTFNLAVALYTDSLQPVSLRAKENEPDFGGFYSLQLNNPMVTMLLVTKKDPLKQIGQAFVPQFAQTNRAHIAIKADKTTHTILLLVNGAAVQRFVDPDGFGGQGTGVRFVHQGMGAIRVGNIRVTPWDGRLEERAAAPSPREDVALLLNRDRVGGVLQTIREGKATFAIGATPLEVPLARVALIEMASEKVQPTPARPGDVRVSLNPRGSLTFALESWDEQHVVARSPNFGTVNFNPQAFTRLQFHAAP